MLELHRHLAHQDCLLHWWLLLPCRPHLRNFLKLRHEPRWYPVHHHDCKNFYAADTRHFCFSDRICFTLYLHQLGHESCWCFVHEHNCGKLHAFYTACLGAALQHKHWYKFCWYSFHDNSGLNTPNQLFSGSEPSTTALVPIAFTSIGTNSDGTSFTTAGWSTIPKKSIIMESMPKSQSNRNRSIANRLILSSRLSAKVVL